MLWAYLSIAYPQNSFIPFCQHVSWSHLFVQDWECGTQKKLFNKSDPSKQYFMTFDNSYPISDGRMTSCRLPICDIVHSSDWTLGHYSGTYKLLLRLHLPWHLAAADITGDRVWEIKFPLALTTAEGQRVYAVGTAAKGYVVVQHRWARSKV